MAGGINAAIRVIILDDSIEPGKVFDATTDLDGVPAGYQDIADRTRLEVLLTH